ncbi:MAG TPA: slipin family protein [Candidatus Obscuribacterales bacterium]
MFQTFIVLVILFGLITLIASIRICNEWQRKLVLRLGRFAGVRGPGLFLLIPYLETSPFTLDMRMITSSFLAEQTLTKDNVPVNVDTVIYWRVVDAQKAVLEVADYVAAVMGAAQTALRDIIGRTNLSDVLSERQMIDTAMTEILEKQTAPWGIKVQSVQMRDIKIPDTLQDAMSRVAQADREGQARLLLGQSEVNIAKKFAEAGDLYASNPMALHLRGMNMLYEVMKAGGTATVVVPSTAVESMNFGTISGVTALARSEGGARPPAT